ncbi:hypothetical protein BDN72DRAFT_807171 [Pluteus cervinus]|uniref:Uncharacterized protein n=1 Tax=Pluteus cervinus TaxID=181527 RepID=A0ACD3BGB3_9AGAR|nr:hypothetical protein BDN72DRAFT_807171 [Pluteus cervinus]
MTPMPRKRGPPTALRIDTPAQNLQIALAVADSSLSSATSESDCSPFSNLPSKARSSRNMKKLSLNLPSAQSSSNSLQLPPEPQSAVNPVAPELPRVDRPRRPSIISLPPNPTSSLVHRREEEDGSPTVPYVDGPVQVLPGIWLGSEDNARDWTGLIERGIKAILNVAKEVSSPFDNAATAQPLRSVVSTPNFKSTRDANSTYYPAHPASGRPGMHYLKLQWSHGQQDLVKEGFKAAMTFTDAALERGDGVLIHCQCGISRSATLVIALVMRAAAERSPSVPSEIWALKGMQGAYNFVKEKSRWVGPNMSLIYQLLEYEKTFKGPVASPTSSERSSILADEDEEWGRRRRMLDETSDTEEDRESSAVLREAQALDKAMEDRAVARKNSASSIVSTGSGVGMGPAWRSRYNRKRTGSIASNLTGSSIISEDLAEEDEEHEPRVIALDVRYDDDQPSSSSAEHDESTSNSPDDDNEKVTHRSIPFTLANKVPGIRALPSAPVWKISFNLPPPPATANRTSFDLPPQTKAKRRPPPMNFLSPIPPSPITVVVDDAPPISKATPVDTTPTPRARVPRKGVPPPLPLRSNLLKKPNPTPKSTQLFPAMPVSTPSQTLFVFPPSPSTATRTRTPSTMTLSNVGTPLTSVFMTPRVSSFRSQGRTKSFIGVGAPATPTTAFSKVDARGYVGLE